MQAILRGGAVFAALLGALLVLPGCGSANARVASHVRRAEMYLAQGNLQKAQVEYRNAMQIAPTRADLRVMTGHVAERLGDIRAAAALYQSAIDLDSAYVPAREGLGKLYVFAGVPRRALDIIRPALLQHPDDASLLTVRGAAFAELKDRAGALADAERAVQLAPQNEDAVSLLASLYEQGGEVERAARLVAKSLGRAPASLDLHRILASLYGKLGKLDLAERQLQAVVNLDPKELLPRYQLALFYARSNRLPQAERVFEDAIAARPDDEQPKLAYAQFITAHRSAREGERVLAGFIAREPDKYDLRLALADLERQNGELDAAMAGYRDLAARAGEQPQGLLARDRLAAVLIGQKRYDEAARRIAEVLAKSPGDSDALVLRADMAMARGEPAAAIVDLRTVLRDRPGSAPLLRALARALIADHQTALAEESLRNAMDAAPRDSAARIDLAQLLGQTGRVDEAAALLKQTIEASPQDLEAREALVRTYLAKPDLEAARTAVEELETAAPARWTGPYLAGVVAEARNSPDEAEADFRRALELQPASVDVLAAISRLDLRRGRADQAVARVRSSIASRPGDPALRNLLGELYLATKAYALAEGELTRCTQLAPKWWLPYRNLGVAFASSGNGAQAVRTYEQGIAMSGLEPSLVGDLATLYERQGRPEDAIREYEAFHRQYPGSAFAANNLAMLLVTYRKDRQSLEEARDLTTTFADADDPALLDTFAWVRLKLGRPAEALPMLERATERAPQLRVIHYHLGMAELAMGQRDRARQELQAALAGSAAFTGSQDARSALAGLGAVREDVKASSAGAARG